MRQGIIDKIRIGMLMCFYDFETNKRIKEEDTNERICYE